MSKKKAYIHLDFESTSLQPWKGHARSFGLVITDHELKPYGEAEHSEWVHPDLWSKTTLDWAAETYGPEFLTQSMEQGLKDWRHVWAHLTDEFKDCLKKCDSVFGPMEYWVVCNHTDFDFTLLRTMFDLLTRECPIKYNHSLDLQSLMVGFESGYRRAASNYRIDGVGPTQNVNALRNAYDKRGGKENVTHHALEDARAQVEMLRAQGVRLPS